MFWFEVGLRIKVITFMIFDWIRVRVGIDNWFRVRVGLNARVDV